VSIEVQEEMKEMQKQCQDLITRARAEKDAKIQECEELRSQVRKTSNHMINDN
jgi:F0F1-type ATP synthase membrane subunit b/b'